MINTLRIGVILTAVAVVTAVLAPVQILCLFLDLRLRRYLPGLWHRIVCKLLGLRIHTRGSLEKRRPLMIACNHASWLDILVLGAVVDVVFVAKSEVRDWPIFGHLARLQASIFIQREDRRKTGHQVNEIAQRLSADEIVVLFPEGTTSDGNRVLPIKSSLFGAATSAVRDVADQIVWVQPTSLAYTKLNGLAMGRFHRPLAAWPGDVELLPHLSGILKEGALDVEVSFMPAIAFTAASNRKEVSRQVEDEIRLGLQRSLREPL
ncbi:1-acyl-sn-glycerol-3-phosphate acyltransferase [Rhizobium sp. L1K21]|uniref:lysophospholipid acyltransferase family protein n=1 Tax=Rhizobium sp. L1K21 TaxID=2954933 RepID=UPI002092A223|nr:lysophospholipid acyltransferase family protein [Rhizobium sp. L1K21]MCO6187379.1 1-acyl-sn-glycerol-3-phosphate acyltransferase [Rhizobium sp. L1K21]